MSQMLHACFACLNLLKGVDEAAHTDDTVYLMGQGRKKPDIVTVVNGWPIDCHWLKGGMFWQQAGQSKIIFNIQMSRIKLFCGYVI